MDNFSALWEKEDLLKKVSEHRFFKDFLSGNLTANSYFSYLKLEFDFVKTAAQSYGAAISRTTNLEHIRELSRALYGLTHEQFIFFQHVEENEINQEFISKENPSYDSELKIIFQGLTSHGSFTELLVAFYAAESLYSTWCAMPVTATSLSESRQSWIDMHRTHEFLTHRAWLGKTIMNELQNEHVDTRHLKALFRNVLSAESDFHNIPYPLTE